MIGTTFTEQSAARIARVVRTVEQGTPEYVPSRDAPVGPSIAKPMRICKTSAEFKSGQTAALPVYESGTPQAPTRTGTLTINAINIMGTIPADTYVFVHQAANGSYYVHAAACS